MASVWLKHNTNDDILCTTGESSHPYEMRTSVENMRTVAVEQIERARGVAQKVVEAPGAAVERMERIRKWKKLCDERKYEMFGANGEKVKIYDARKETERREGRGPLRIPFWLKVSLIVSFVAVYATAPLSLYLGQEATCHGGPPTSAYIFALGGVAIVTATDFASFGYFADWFHSVPRLGLGWFYDERFEMHYSIGRHVIDPISDVKMLSLDNPIFLMGSGKLETADTYTDFFQPGQVSACEKQNPKFKEKYLRSWHRVPIVGKYMQPPSFTAWMYGCLALALISQVPFRIVEAWSIYRSMQFTTYGFSAVPTDEEKTGAADDKFTEFLTSGSRLADGLGAIASGKMMQKLGEFFESKSGEGYDGFRATNEFVQALYGIEAADVADPISALCDRFGVSTAYLDNYINNMGEGRLGYMIDQGGLHHLTTEGQEELGKKVKMERENIKGRFVLITVLQRCLCEACLSAWNAITFASLAWDDLGQGAKVKTMLSLCLSLITILTKAKACFSVNSVEYKLRLRIVGTVLVLFVIACGFKVAGIFYCDSNIFQLSRFSCLSP